MNRKYIIEKLKYVKPYDKGSHVMWTDKYISEQLLNIHIDPECDRASRKTSSVAKTIEWIMGQLPDETVSLMDLGCGPGLYTSEFAKKGLNVTGIDFSMNSINYAINTAKSNELDINYECMNYLELEYDGLFDVIIMIYCDFGVLSEVERKLLLDRVYKALKPGGIFIFDSYNEKVVERLSFKKEWEISEGGFWQEDPYMCLSESIHFPEIKGFLDQFIVIDDNSNYKLYRFWNHYFSKEYLDNLFESRGFSVLEAHNNILLDDGVTFFKARKDLK